MSSPIVFESTESVIAVLWDIALAVFALRLAFFYLGLVALSTGLLAWASQHLPAALAAYTSGSSGTLALVLAALLVPVHCNGVIVYFFEVPRVAGFRLAIGAATLLFVALGSLLATLLVPAHAWAALRVSLPATAAATGGTLKGLAALAVASVTLMPWLSMVLLEHRWKHRRPATTTTTTDEKKVPSVLVSDTKTPLTQVPAPKRYHKRSTPRRA